MHSIGMQYLSYGVIITLTLATMCYHDIVKLLQYYYLPYAVLHILMTSLFESHGYVKHILGRIINNGKFVLCLFHPPSYPLPTWQPSAASLYLWVCFHSMCSFVLFFRFHMCVRSCYVCLSLSDLLHLA